MQKIILLGGLLICFWGLPVFADETSTSTPEVEAPTSTPEIPKIPTSTLEVIIPTSTPTSTPEIVTPTSTPTTTPEIITPTSTPTSTPEIATSTIFIQIETNVNTIFTQEVEFTACLPDPDATTTTLSAKCALEQLNIDSEWSYWGNDAFLNSIDTYVNDYANGKSWNWFADLEYGQTALNKHIVQENETLLLTYGTYPLKIEATNTTPELNTTTTISLFEFGFNGWDPVWNLSTSSSLNINSSTFKNDTGIYNLLITTTTPIKITGQKPGFITTTELIINPIDTATSTTTPTSTPNTSGGGGNTNPTTLQNELISESEIQTAIDKILDYLKSNQDETGKILDGTVTDWAIMSFGANSQYADDINENGVSLLQYEKEYNLDDPSDLNSCATYPRHILALLSAGVSKDDNAILGLKDKILNTCYQNNEYGLNGINDDVFALISLLSVDINTNETIITNLINNIKDWQLESGAFSWPDWMNPTQKTAGDDITGVSINALKYAKDKGAQIDNQILENAKNYLKSTQLSDGGWGYESTDIMTTSWVLMGINALNEEQDDWFTGAGKNPWHPMINNLNNNGYYESTWVPESPDWFALKHAVPALAGQSWPIILDPVIENFTDGATITYSSSGSSYTDPKASTTTPTSTLEIIIPTSTPTTTIEIIIPSSTPTSTIKISTSTVTTTIDMTSSTPTTTLNVLTKTTVVKKISPQSRVNNINIQNKNKLIQNINKNTTTTQTLLSDKKNKNLNQIQNDNDLEKIINELPIDSPTRKALKKILAISGGGAGALGLYLGLKFLKIIV